MSEPTKDSVEYIANKFAENPGHFAATILRMYWDMKKQRDQYKSENEKLRERNKKLEKRFNQKVRRNVRGGLQQMKIEDLESKCDGMKTENEQLKAQRDTLTDDIAMLKTNISRLERELEVALNGELSTYDELLKYVMELQSELMEYQKENEELYNIANKTMDIAESENEKYIKLTQHIRLKAENNPGVSRYIDLVNYIDRLERD